MTLTASGMAQSIYDALVAAVPLGADEDPAGRRKLAFGIAQGVLAYLKSNQGGFTTSSSGGGGGAHTHSIVIDIDPAS